MGQQVQQAEVELVAHLGTTSITLGDIMNLKVGDILSLDVPEALLAEVDGVPLLECQYGVRNGQYAIKVKRVVGGKES
jgi:flagellar motor switch protein FliM